MDNFVSLTYYSKLRMQQRSPTQDKHNLLTPLDSSGSNMVYKGHTESDEVSHRFESQEDAPL